jgi:flagellar FliJ protein
MAKFKYRMQNVLRVKEKLEEQVKMEFSMAQNAYRTEEEKLEALYERKNRYLLEGQELRKKTLHVREIQENKAALIQMNLYINDQIDVLEKARQALEEVQERLVLAMQERKTHEILKEAEFEEYKKEERAKESMEIDELVSYVYGKKGE